MIKLKGNFKDGYFENLGKLTYDKIIYDGTFTHKYDS